MTRAESRPVESAGPTASPPADVPGTADRSHWGELIESLGAADGSVVPPPPDACAEALGQMFLYLDQELSDPSTQHRIAEHLELCVDCVAAYDAEKLMRAVVARSCRGERASVELRQRIEFFVSQSAHESAVTTPVAPSGSERAGG
jgi:mycothiol system anti-sigma-R factor